MINNDINNIKNDINNINNDIKNINNDINNDIIIQILNDKIKSPLVFRLNTKKKILNKNSIYSFSNFDKEFISENKDTNSKINLYNVIDTIPSKYDRMYQTDIIIKYLTFIIISLVVIIFLGTIGETIYKLDDALAIFNFIFIIIFFLLDAWWLYYKLQHIVIGIYKLFMDLSIFKTNSKYYSGLEIPDSFFNNIVYPNITIQLPVYKEDLENTIKPTIISAIIQSKRYLLETGSKCNIIVCDDGFNIINDNEREKRKDFYEKHNIGYTARPHPSKYKRIGRFKKAGNLNFSMNYSIFSMNLSDNLLVNEKQFSPKNTNESKKSSPFSPKNTDESKKSSLFSPKNTDESKKSSLFSPKNTDESKKSLPFFEKNLVLDINDIFLNDKLYIKYNELLELGAKFSGNILYGDYIFLIDSDTRLPDFPEDKNGCLKRMVKDYLFDGRDKVLYMQCYTCPYLSIKSLSEKCVFHFTCHIYNGILVATALKSMAPLVGHNALLNFKLLDEIAIIDNETNFKYYWSEDRISEDFDCMMRGCEKGYIGRYCISAGIFLEGISFNYITEYFKVSKFACGAAELTFNPISKWFVKGGGFFSSDIIGFIYCKEIEWYNKLAILSYILNFIAIAQAHIAMFYNLLFFEELFYLLPYPLLPVNLMIEGIIVWGLINTIINILFAKRVNFNTYVVIKQQFRELFFTSSLYGSLSVRFSIMYFTHLFNLNISFGATQKDDEKVRLLDWIKSTKYECGIYTFYLICIILRVFVFTVKSPIHTFYFGCLPLFTNIFWYWFGPIVYDILPSKKNKTNTESYNNDEKMYDDKYLTQIPISNIFNNF
jgi:hypothetical protein